MSGGQRLQPARLLQRLHHQTASLLRHHPRIRRRLLLDHHLTFDRPVGRSSVRGSPARPPPPASSSPDGQPSPPPPADPAPAAPRPPPDLRPARRPQLRPRPPRPPASSSVFITRRPAFSATTRGSGAGCSSTTT